MIKASREDVLKRLNVRSSSARLAMLLAVALLAGDHIASAQQPAIQRKVLLQTAVYCGVPAANAAFRVARDVLG